MKGEMSEGQKGLLSQDMKKIGIIAVYKEDVHGPFSRLYHDYINAIEKCEDVVVHIIPCNTRHIDHFISEMDGFILPGGNDVDPCVYGHDNIASKDTFSKNDVRVLGFIKEIVGSKKPLL
jgi:gamma-glutamyl-gamma-aminobutyrate hydrolase PuuD